MPDTDRPTPTTGAMAVLFCANPGYFQHLGVASRSVADASPDAAIDFHVLTCDTDPDAERKLRDTLAESRLSITLHRVTDARLDGYFVDKFMTKECYLRILAPEILPLALSRVLYLDCDLVALDDLRPLWETDLQGKAVGAVPDYPRLPSVMSPERRRTLGIPLDLTYVNSGVLLIDLDRWRRLGLTQPLLDYVAAKGPALEFWDQDAFNAVIPDELHLLDCRWNLQARMYRCGRRGYPLEFEATREARRRPAILHYTGSEKPWLFRSGTPRKRDYLRFLAKTAWRDERPRLESGGQRAEYEFDRFLAALGIDYMRLLHYARRVPEKLAQVTGDLRKHRRGTTQP